MKKTARFAAVGVIAALALTACGGREDDGADEGSDNSSDAPVESTERWELDTPPVEVQGAAGPYPDTKACMVSDSGGFDDKSFNQTSHLGMENAVANYDVQTAEAESQDPSQFEDNIASLVDQKCTQITTVGFLLGDATLAAAQKAKNVDFAIVDFAYSDESGANTAPPNLKGLLFDTGAPSFLAGYLAASESESGIVGTFGGQQIPSVTAFMTGYYQGVQYYNEETGEDVQVLGWDPAAEEGSFTDDFENQGLGEELANEMISQGADVIFPVAGPAGLGGLKAAQDADAWGIWVDTDGCESAAEYCDSLLTSVVKGMDVAVEQAIVDSANGDFNNEPYLGTLENGGVGLAPISPEVDEETVNKIEELLQGIISGDVTVE